MLMQENSPDFRHLFQTLPGLYIVLLPDLTIAAVTDEYLRATMTKREMLVGRNIFDVFPDNPNNDEAHNSASVRQSFEKVFQTGERDELPLIRYDVRRPLESGGGFDERFWQLVTFPLQDETGAVAYVIHRVEDVTTQVKKESEKDKLNVELTFKAEQIESERQHIADALDDARLRLESALVAGEIGTWTWDIQNDRVVADKNLAHFFSVSKGDAAGGKVENYIAAVHPEDRGRVETLIAAALENQDSYEAEYRLLNPNGNGDENIRWVVARGKILRDDNGAPAQLSGVVIDITTRKKTEESLRESERRLKFALDAGRLGSYELDLTTNEMICSERCLANFGLPPKTEFSLEKFLTMIKDEDRERVRESIEKSIAENTDYEIEYQIARADDEAAWIFARGRALYDEQGKPLVMNGVTLDITERRETEEALKKSQERLQLVLDSSVLGLWYCDLPFDVLNWSVQTKEHFWLAPDATVTIEDFYRIIHADDREKTRQAIDASIVNRTQYDVEYRTVNPQDNRVKWIRAIGRGFYDQNNAPYRFDGITIDVSQEKMIETEREHLLSNEKTARGEAEQANRMKDEFLATLSHELRTPLSAILGWSRMLKDNRLSDEQKPRAVEIIERSAKSQAQLIEDVLDVSRIISGKMRLEVKPIDLHRIIETAIDSVRPAADARNIILQRVLDSDAMISGDADRIQQILWNLLSNAIKFTPKDGKVQIKMERVNSHVEIIVSDTGTGIDAETLPYVFERFRQSDSSTTRKYGGLGLGLAIVRHLVELHGGTVYAASEGIERGATFTIIFPLIALRSNELPIKENETAADRVHPTTREENVPFVCPAGIKDLRVLLVDDEADMREMVLFVLEYCEAKVKNASSADEALEILKTEKFDVLISDIGMPDRDGYDLIKSVRSLSPEENGGVPAIALTAYARVEDRLKVLSAGFQMHVPKPIEPAELLAVIASLTTWKK